ncbi:MAG: ATP:cob(I)alamin adenosyltransferase, partial [Candidatus Thermoplasmatota archaeon]|nr:ATP:cob(I)alamin adenosyltransferase [Candidatus Thermoplasmatota archaeon]
SRTVVRRAERYACSIIQEDPDGLRDTVVVYLNRLSDWLFVLARWFTLKQGEDETLWVPLGKRNA